MNNQNTLNKVLEVLKSISQQWDIKKLPINFFVLPYELDETISELQKEIYSKKTQIEARNADTLKSVEDAHQALYIKQLRPCTLTGLNYIHYQDIIKGLVNKIRDFYNLKYLTDADIITEALENEVKKIERFSK